MKRIAILAFSAAFMAACNNQAQKADLAKATQDLINNEKTWNDVTVKGEFAKNIETYYDTDVIIFMSGSQPLKGRAALVKFGQEHPDTWNGLSWKNEKAEVATSCDAGFTWGRWQQTYKTSAGTDTTIYGVYSTVYRKEADGKWYAILDETNATPKPE